MQKTREMTAEDFETLSAGQKERIWRDIDRKTTEQLYAESNPLNARERRQWSRFQRTVGRPKIGRGTTNISISMEKDLLRQFDRFARKAGMSRSELIARGVRAIIEAAA
jgi:hypothetical protein